MTHGSPPVRSVREALCGPGLGSGGPIHRQLRLGVQRQAEARLRPKPCAMLEDGLADVLVAYAVDRLTRSVTDLEGLDQLVPDQPRTQGHRQRGPRSVHRAREGWWRASPGSVARGEVERKGTRQRDTNERRAARGEPRKACPRPFGWQEDRIHRQPDEAEAIREAARAVLGNGTLSGIGRDWAGRGVRPTQAPFGPLPEFPWTRASIKDIMLNPSLAGIPSYRGDELEGVTGRWEPILTVEQFKAVRAVLTSPSRGRAPGVRTMLGGAREVPVRQHRDKGARIISASLPTSATGQPEATDPGPHVAIRSEAVDAWIEFEVLQRLCAEDAHRPDRPGNLGWGRGAALLGRGPDDPREPR